MVEHLSALRKVLISSAIFFVFVFAVALVCIQFILPFITKGHHLYMLGPLDVVRLYMQIAGSIGLGISLPFIGYQFWRFVNPALTSKESKKTLAFVPAIFLSFLAGIAFGYFIVFPTAYHFLTHLGAINFEMMITTRSYFSFLMLTTIPFGFLFEVPLVLMLLTALEVITPEKLSKVRKYAYVLLAVLSAFVTPPDFISQLLVLAPMIALYELGIYLSKVTYKRKQKMNETASAF